METDYKHGDRVTVTAGQWAGFHGDFQAMEFDSGRAVVLLQIGFSLKRVEIPLAYVKRYVDTNDS